MKSLYEVFDEFELAKNKKERMDVISKNLTQTLVDVLRLAYHPTIQWKIKNYQKTTKCQQICYLVLHMIV
jgi:hypothetical protein